MDVRMAGFENVSVMIFLFTMLPHTALPYLRAKGAQARLREGAAKHVRASDK